MGKGGWGFSLGAAPYAHTDTIASIPKDAVVRLGESAGDYDVCWFRFFECIFLVLSLCFFFVLEDRR